MAIADVVMSLDNVLAIAAAAKGNTGLIVFGLAISIPLIVAGATLIMGLLTKYPILVWAGAGLLGWIAGELLVTDKAALLWLQDWSATLIVPDAEFGGGDQAGRLDSLLGGHCRCRDRAGLGLDAETAQSRRGWRARGARGRGIGEPR